MVVENKETFCTRLEPYITKREMTQVRIAYMFAKFGHRSQTRKEKGKDGTALRYFEHCRRVALVLMDEIEVYDHELVIAALLHDTLEDTDDITLDVIEEVFSQRSARLIRQLTKIPKEGYYKRILNGDTETRIIKFCDRIDNLRSLISTKDKKFIVKQINDTDDLLDMINESEDSHAFAAESLLSDVLEDVRHEASLDDVLDLPEITAQTHEGVRLQPEFEVVCGGQLHKKSIPC